MIDSHWHLVPEEWGRMPAERVAILRPRLEWLRSYWCHRERAGWHGYCELDAVGRNCSRFEDFVYMTDGWVSRMYASYLLAVPGVRVFHSVADACAALGLPEPGRLNASEDRPDLGVVEHMEDQL